MPCQHIECQCVEKPACVLCHDNHSQKSSMCLTCNKPVTIVVVVKTVTYTLTYVHLYDHKPCFLTQAFWSACIRPWLFDLSVLYLCSYPLHTNFPSRCETTSMDSAAVHSDKFLVCSLNQSRPAHTEFHIAKCQFCMSFDDPLLELCTMN